MLKYKGFTLVELVVVMGIFATLAGISTISLFNIQHKTTLNASVSTFIADLKGQQLRVMVGESGGTGSASDYGLRLQDKSYTLFRSTYGTTNSVIDLAGGLEFTSPNYEIIFLKGSGEISTGSTAITIKDAVDGSKKTIDINRYGIVTGVN